MNIAFYNHKGGVGKTTFILHLAYMSMQRDLNNMIIDTDRQQNTFSTLSNGEVKSSNEIFEKGSIKVSNNIKHLKDYDYDNAFIDTPPAFEVVEDIHENIDKWIIPIDGRSSVTGTLNFLQEAEFFKINKSDIMLVLNKVYDNRPISRIEKKEVGKIGIKLYDLPIYDHDVFRRSEVFEQAAWDVPYGIRSKATQNIQAFSSYVLTKLVKE